MGGEVEVEEIGGGIQHAQRAVQLKGIHVELPVQPLGEHDLEDVPLTDVLLGSHHVVLEPLPLRLCDRVERLGRTGRRQRRQGAVQHGLHPLEDLGRRARLLRQHLAGVGEGLEREAVLGAAARRCRRCVAGHEGSQVHPAPQVVEGHQGPRQDEPGERGEPGSSGFTGTRGSMCWMYS